MKRKKSIFQFLSLLFIVAFSLTFICCTGAGRGSGRSLPVQVVSKDENSKAIKGATIRMMRGKDSKTFHTIEGGRVTIEPAYKLPFQLEVSYKADDMYLPKTIDITEDNFNEGKLFIVRIERKKTVITGKVVDKQTKEPLPVVTVEVKPKVTYVQTDSLGIFHVQSAEIKQGLTYTIKFTREKPIKNRKYKDFEKNLDNLDIYETNDIGIIEMASYEIEADEMKEGQIQLQSQSGAEPTYE